MFCCQFTTFKSDTILLCCKYHEFCETKMVVRNVYLKHIKQDKQCLSYKRRIWFIVFVLFQHKSNDNQHFLLSR